MNPRHSTKPIRLRTYAADLEQAREENHLLSQTEPTVRGTEVSTKKSTASADNKRTNATAKSPQSFKRVEKKATPPPIPKSQTTLKKESTTPANESNKPPIAVPVPKPAEPQKQGSEKTQAATPIPKQTPPTLASAHKVTSKPSKIPAFHELQKNAASGKKNPLGSGDYETKIIRETKKRSFNPFVQSFSALKNWLKSLTQRKTTDDDTAVIEKDVVVPEKTVQKTPTNPVAPQTPVVETPVPHSPLEEAAKQKLQHEPHTHWSPQTEPVFELLQSPDQVETPHNVAVGYKNISTDAAAAPIPVTQPSYPSENGPEPVVPQPVSTATEPVADAATVLESRPASATAPTTETPTPTAIVNENKPPEPTTQDQHSIVSTGRAPLLENTDTNTLTLQITAGVISLLAIIITGTMVFNSFTATDSTETLISAPTKIIPSANIQTITITPETHSTLPELLADTISQAPAGLVEYVLVDETGSTIPAAQAISILDFATKPIFNQSLSEVHFVSINQSRPAILFTFSDKETIQGTMLDWERQMTSDIGTLYKVRPSDSVTFADQLINGEDVRVLSDENGTILMYSFLDENTILITSSRADFTQIADLYSN